MPNFTTCAGVEAYAAVMNFLAERLQPAGRKVRANPRLDSPQRNQQRLLLDDSRRQNADHLSGPLSEIAAADAAARPAIRSHAKPLISLDHYWSKNADARGYPARELLDQLVNFGQKEGDFEWGIAFHPYAQDLFNPRTWEDREVTFDFNTPLITFKNIEVLDAWVRQPRVCFRGQEPRKIQLTEQGLNSRDYSETAFAIKRPAWPTPGRKSSR